MTSTDTELTLYQQVAERVVGMIESGALRTGDRVPSVRKLSRQLDVSISTVLQAYQLLEARGFVHARPQSGYYVRSNASQRTPEPRASTPGPTPRQVSITSPVLRMLREMHSDNIVGFGSADPPEHCLPTEKLNRLSSAIARRTREGHGWYDAPPGQRELRAQVARLMTSAGCTLDPDSLITTVGCQEAVTLCLRALTRPGDLVAIESPTFYGHLMALEMLGLRAVEIPTNPGTGVDLDAFAAVVSKQKIRAALLVTNGHNPLGYVMPTDRKRQLFELLEQHDVALVEDDIYGDMCFDLARPPLVKTFDTDDRRVLLCSSFSKTLAPGARVGWCAVPAKWREQVMRHKFANTISTPTLSQKMIAAFVASGGYERHVRSIRRTYAQQIQRFAEMICAVFPDGTRLSRPAGGFVLWVEMPRAVDSELLQKRAMEKLISVAPGTIFSPTKRFRNCIRINCGPEWNDRTRSAIATLGQLAGELAR